MTTDAVWWLVAAGGGAALVAGLVLALGVRWINPALPLGRTWAYYALLFAFLVGVVLAVGLT